MAKLLVEFEGLTKPRTKTVMKKIDHCGFNTIVTHLQVQCTTFDYELSADDQQENKMDLQPVQPNSIYLKCGVLKAADQYVGKGDITKLADKRHLAPHIKLMTKARAGAAVTPLVAVIPTESPIEDEIARFDLTVQEDIVFQSPNGSKSIGFYNHKSNILWLSDLIHNPMRAELLLDRAVSYVYEFQKVGSLGVISPIFDKYRKDLDKSGFANGNLWWTGLDDAKDAVYIDGKLDVNQMLTNKTDDLIKSGVDIFFLRALKNYTGSMELTVDKGVAKLTLNQSGYRNEQLTVPAHTTLEQEIKAIEDYVSNYAATIAKEFYTKAQAELKNHMKK